MIWPIFRPFLKDFCSHFLPPTTITFPPGEGGGGHGLKNDLLNFLALSDHFLKVFFFKKNPPTILFYWWGQGSETLMWGVANFSGFAHSSLVFFSEADNFFLLKEYKRLVCNICCLCCLPLKILTLKPFLLCRNASAYNIQAPVNLKHPRYYA